MTTEAQRRAHAAHRERLKAQGVRSVTIRLTPPAWSELERLAKVHGSKDKAVEAMLMGGMLPPAEYDLSSPASKGLRIERGQVVRAEPKLSAPAPTYRGRPITDPTEITRLTKARDLNAPYLVGPLDLHGEMIVRQAKQKDEGKKR